MTKKLHFYAIGKGQPLSFVDMPGYGFAYADDDRIDAWNQLMLEYLRFRGDALKRVCLLLDARHGIKQVDTQFLSLLYDKVREVTDSP